MPLWPRPEDDIPPPDLDAITREVHAFTGGPLNPREAYYLEFHRQRYQDTLRLLPPGQGRQLLDLGSYPGHLSALAEARGWVVTGLNSAVEAEEIWAPFLERCRARSVRTLRCDVEREPFPVPTGSMDAVLLCELFEHLYMNPFHTLREVFRVLRPGGLLILTTPNVRRVETFSRLLRGWGPQPPVGRDFHELLPSLLYHRHHREYTARELTYFLALQGKDLYDFRLDRVYASSALDAPHEVPAVLGQRVSRLEYQLARVFRRLVPGLRGQLIARAWRTDATLVEWPTLRAVTGFGPLEEDERPWPGFTRRLTFPFRLTEAHAGFEVPLPDGEGPALVSLLVASPDCAVPLRTEWMVDGSPVMRLDLPPSFRPLRVRLLVPEAAAARGAARVEVRTTPWFDAFRGREVGIHVGGQWVLAERLPGQAAVQAAIARTRAERQAEDSLERWWLGIQTLYIPHSRLSPALEIGRGDEDQLGPGWHHRERWRRIGWMRWTSGRAEAYLGHDGRARRGWVRVYSGEPRLGAVAGRLVLESVGPDGRVRPAGARDFNLAPDTWADLSAPLEAPAGPVRMTLEVTPVRVPRERVPGSTDSRGLGLSVGRLWLGR